MSSSVKSNEFRPWGVNMVESNGDYREEAFLEQVVGGPLYSNQSSMPRLPVPSIADTLKRFLPTALPLARTKEEEAKLKEACQNFPDQAQELQQRLVERRDGEFRDSSWLQLWWNQTGYLQVRDPVVVNVSYFFSFVDDPTIRTSSSMPNVQRAATMLFATAEFRKQVVTGKLPPEVIGKKTKTPICATAYKYMFNACRVPRLEQDSYRIYDPSLYTHCIVARKGHFFSMEMVHPETGNPLPVAQLEEQLGECISIADSLSSSRKKLGLLTSQNRDDWALGREELVLAGGIAMRDALERLESGAILLNLDDESPVSRQECGELFWTGGLKSGENRWFDKSIQIMITNNGKAGLIAEHSMMDGMPVINFANYITTVTYSQVKRKSLHQPETYKSIPYPVVQDIFAETLASLNPDMVTKLEARSWASFSKLITDHVLHVQSFQGYGSSFMKKAGFPPDAFAQTAMQLATYRLFGEQVGTYEATQVRTFLHGRTEVTRGVSTESEAFVKRMGFRPLCDESDPAACSEKIDLLRKATNAHAKYTSLAAKAQGVDRHLMGLSLMVKEGERKPDLYSDEVYARSKHWRSSTSNLSHPRFNLWGYGEVVPDGVGLAYAVLPNSCVFNITALKITGYSDKLAELLEEAFLEMRGLIESQSSLETISKL
ncbi:choline/carnitine o-acyltransferase [Nitzschia inconspicua]|uniref:Choline/carnitine o-acyltransferase n=1 Tax=Nitzschia inconspicua TaxID=303405 RepID=A0A9K3KMV9_9STRA|nr:choline/carnitine o-acyltransferase [Nitzschia inconspicua]